MEGSIRRTRLVACLVAVVVLASVLGACGSSSGTRPPAGSPASSAAAPGSAGPDQPGAGGTQPGGGASQPGGDADPDVDFTTIPQIVREVEPSVVSILRSDAQGSGVIWSADVVVTNNHVVDGVTELTIAFADGTRARGHVLARDPLTDLAVVKSDRNNLPPATFAPQVPPVGSLAIAIGNPLGFENSVTAGIVSGQNRSIPGAAASAPALVDLVQTDAPISPGNSGGALVGPDGRIIGINVAYLPPQESGAVAIGFAIPAPTVVDVVDQLLKTGRVEHAFLGVQSAPITPEIAERFGLGQTTGALVVDVVPDSPAAKAGIKPGDVIVRVGDAQVNAVEDLLAALRHHQPGDQVTVRILRNGQQRDVVVTLGTLPSG